MSDTVTIESNSGDDLEKRIAEFLAAGWEIEWRAYKDSGRCVAQVVRYTEWPSKPPHYTIDAGWKPTK
jgi:hypothetical protein